MSVLFGPETLVTASIATLLGAGSAAGSLALARRADEMSLPRFAAWGAVAGLLLSMPLLSALGFSLVNVVLAGVQALMCAGCAAGSLALARRADEMSLPRFAAWAGVGGLLLSMLLFSVDGGFSLVNVAMIGFLALMSAGCAASSLILARNAHDEDLLEACGSTGKIEGE